jgi:hypothetical protein
MTAPTIDIVQQRCGHDACIAWRLSRPDSAGQSWPAVPPLRDAGAAGRGAAWLSRALQR